MGGGERTRPAAVIVDINLDGRFRGRDGLQLGRELARAYLDVRIVLVSGFLESTCEALARSIPGAVFMEKAALSGDALRALLKWTLIKAAPSAFDLV